MEINLFALFLAVIAAFFIGFIWYGVVFLKPWQKEVNYDSKIHAASETKVLISTFALEFVMAVIFAVLIGKDADWLFGLGAGLALGFGLVSLTLGVTYLNERRSFKLWLINAGHSTLIFAVMGAILGAF